MRGAKIKTRGRKSESSIRPRVGGSLSLRVQEDYLVSKIGSIRHPEEIRQKKGRASLVISPKQDYKDKIDEVEHGHFRQRRHEAVLYEKNDVPEHIKDGIGRKKHQDKDEGLLSPRIPEDERRKSGKEIDDRPRGADYPGVGSSRGQLKTAVPIQPPRDEISSQESDRDSDKRDCNIISLDPHSFELSRLKTLARRGSPIQLE